MIFAQTAPLTIPSIGWLAIAPEIVLGVGAALLLLFAVQFKPAVKALGAFYGALVALAFGLAVYQWNNIPSFQELGSEGFVAAAFPFGQMIIFDRTAVFVRFAILTVAALGVVVGWGLFEKLQHRAAEALALVLLATAGFSFMGSSVHLMMIFLGLEIGSISLYVLAGITRERSESDEAAIKYFLLGSVASAVFVYGVALVFAGTGNLNIAAIQSFFNNTVLFDPAVVLIGMAMLLAGLGFKISAVPFHSWAPDVYQGAPAGIVGFMAAAAKIGGFAALTRIFLSAFPSLSDAWAPLVAAVAVASMVVGAVLAVVQDDIKRLLAYSGVAHAGFILTGLVAGGQGGVQIWFYLAVYVVQLVGAFGVVAFVGGSTGSRSAISSYAGLASRQPAVAAIFSVLLLGLAGFPLTSGFIAKFGVFSEAWSAGFEWLVVVGVLSSVIGLYFYLRIVVTMYMHDPVDEAVAGPGIGLSLGLAFAAVVTLVLGVFPGPLLDLVQGTVPF